MAGFSDTAALRLELDSGLSGQMRRASSGPLAVRCTVGEEDGGQSQGVHHGHKPAPLLEPVLPRAAQAAGIVQDSAAQLVSLMVYHVPQFIQRQACIPCSRTF